MRCVGRREPRLAFLYRTLGDLDAQLRQHGGELVVRRGVRPRTVKIGCRPPIRHRRQPGADPATSAINRQTGLTAPASTTSRGLWSKSASNQHGWQWTAGTGTDAAPSFRIFNPIGQGKKLDPDPGASYVRRYVPELRGLSGTAAHEPWRASRRRASRLRRANRRPCRGARPIARQLPESAPIEWTCRRALTQPGAMYEPVSGLTSAIRSCRPPLRRARPGAA